MKFIALTVPARVSKLTIMVVHLKPETESRLQELAATTGRAPDDLVEDAMSGYLAELTEVRNMLDGRYDDIKSGRLPDIDGEDAFAPFKRAWTAAVHERICSPSRRAPRRNRSPRSESLSPLTIQAPPTACFAKSTKYSAPSTT